MKKAAFLVSCTAVLASVFAMPASANYWGYSQAANSYCDQNGQVGIWIRFTNSDSHATGQSVTVTATDEQSGVQVPYGAVASKATVDKDIYTGMYSNVNGRVRFDVVFQDGSSETDYATYSGKVCSNGPVATPTPAATIQPSAAPTTGGNGQPPVTPSAAPQGRDTTPNGDGLTDGLGCAVRDCSGNVVGGTGGVVAGTATELPQTGANVLGSIIGLNVLALGLAMKKVAAAA